MSHDHAAKVAMIEHNEEVFEVEDEQLIGDFLLLKVFYPNCPNGRKVMLFRAENAPAKPYTKINPHFGRSDSPFARFEPTEKGEAAAKTLAKALSNPSMG